MSNSISEFITIIFLPPFLGVSFFFIYSVFVNIVFNMLFKKKMVYYREITSEVILMFTVCISLTFVKILYIFKKFPEENPEVLDSLQISLFPPFVTYFGYILLFIVPPLNIFFLMANKPVNKLIKVATVFTLAYFISRFGFISY